MFIRKSPGLFKFGVKKVNLQLHHDEKIYIALPAVVSTGGGSAVMLSFFDSRRLS
jgi:hypothetical protein